MSPQHVEVTVGKGACPDAEDREENTVLNKTGVDKPDSNARLYLSSPAAECL